MTAKKPTDLAQFDDAVKRQDEGIMVKIMAMDGRTPLGFSIRVAGPDSERAKSATEEITDELIDMGNTARLNARETAQRALIYLSKVTMGWEPSVVMDGQELAFSEENALKLYQRFAFIREQVDRAANNRARFTKP